MENNLIKVGQNSIMKNFVKTDDILKDMCGIIEKSKEIASQAVNTTLVQRNWLLGYRIASEELQGEKRAEYGTEAIKKLSRELTKDYGKGFDYSSLYKFVRFYKMFPEILDSSSPKSVPLLSWTHYRVLLQVNDKEARDWYAKEAATQTWSVKTLQRNISSQYYYRMLQTQKKEIVEAEMKELTAEYQNDKLEFIKNPVIAEFLGLSTNTDFTESNLEKSILSNLQQFLMELGKGYAFVARQQHIHTEKQDYFIDLVFYNYILKCFVLIDLKTQKITHQDVGQMDMYIRMYDELKRSEGDNPTIGIVLCSDTDEDTYEDDKRMYYERRTGQYRLDAIPKTRIVNIPQQIKSVTAMFLNNPHGVSGNYGTIVKAVGDKIFNANDQKILYYTSSFALYRIEKFISDGTISKKYNKSRYHAVMLFRIYVSGKKVPKFPENKMEEYCQKIINVLYDDEKCKSVLCKIVDFIAMQPEIDFEDRKTFERKETTDMLLGRTSELKAYLNE